ncbi:hypothetical protein E2C01_023974 [Portunus trituberculatus]|uniref:Uncharacterized protein n=1 Tax=Portunus trituberculatus TaxID=210409 RepID=A0A5B7EBH2_PORTR|nr:hypothetical protein [Portunus trituberculatus]
MKYDENKSKGGELTEKTLKLLKGIKFTRKSTRSNSDPLLGSEAKNTSFHAKTPSPSTGSTNRSPELQGNLTRHVARHTGQYSRCIGTLHQVMASSVWACLLT